MTSLRLRFPLFVVLAAVAGTLLAAPLPAAAAAPAGKRLLVIQAPRQVPAATKLSIPVTVATEVGGGERIGFFHGEYSLDGGKTWTAFCYEQNTEPSVLRHAHVTSGSAGSTIIVRVRVAFRDGLAGDVDYTGAAIRWDDTWKNWRETAAKQAVIRVVAR